MHFSLKCNFTTSTDSHPIFRTESTFIIKFVSLSIYVDSYYILQDPYIMICKSETKTMFIVVMVITHFIYLG
jgi:hypothetical protein